MIKLSIFFVFLLWSHAIWANPALIQAEQLFNEQLYADALPFYEKVALDNPSSDILCRLAQIHYELSNYPEVIKLAKAAISKEQTPESQKEILYLQALSHKHLGEQDEARQTLTSYLSDKEKTSLFHHADALFELGCIKFFDGSLEEAKSLFTDAVQSKPCPRLRTLSHLYLARIAFLQNQKEKAQDILRTLRKSLPENDPLNAEIAYWLARVQQDEERYLDAARLFEEALPQYQKRVAEKKTTDSQDVYKDILYQLGCCYLKIADDASKSRDAQIDYFSKAGKALTQLSLVAPEEHSFLTLGEYFLTKARRLQDNEAYRSAEEILAKQELFITPQAKAQAILLRAGAAPLYADRDRLYRELTQEEPSANPLHANGWYMYALNDFEEGQRFLSQGHVEEAKILFHQASNAFKQAYLLLLVTAPAKAGLSLKYQALAAFNQETEPAGRESWDLLNQLIYQEPILFQSLENQAEIFYLSGLFASHLIEKNHQSELIPLAEKNLKEGISRFPSDVSAAEMLNLLGHLYGRQHLDSEAELTFVDLEKRFPQHHLAGEALFWAAFYAERLKKDDVVIKQYKQQVYEKHPDCRYAAEAYFSSFSCRDYLQGSRSGLKHLEGMAARFPRTPLLISAYYLIGLNYKKERLSMEGRVVRRKNLLAAIDAFQEAELAFDVLNQNGLIPANEFEYFVTLRYQSTLERALSNLAIAEESQGTKRQIYLEYAEEVFGQVVHDFSSPEHPLASLLIKNEPYHRLWEESEFWLAHTYIQGDHDDAAEKVLAQMLNRYRQADVTKGYFLSRTWFEKGMIAMRRQNYALALEDFSKAENAANGRVLSPNQRLDLWIQQSLCYKGLQQLDQAMLLLSQVINDDAISGLRLKAMYLRAEIYELQGRGELALKQLEATARKGGVWGAKAKEELKSRLKNLE